jgi:hypothetical protein
MKEKSKIMRLLHKQVEDKINGIEEGILDMAYSGRLIT